MFQVPVLDPAMFAAPGLTHVLPDVTCMLIRRVPVGVYPVRVLDFPGGTESIEYMRCDQNQ